MKSLRNKLLISFLAFSLISLLIIVPSSNYYFDKKEAISNIIYKSEVMNKKMLEDFRVITKFFRHEPASPDFFISHSSTYLETHAQHIQKIEKQME